MLLRSSFPFYLAFSSTELLQNFYGTMYLAFSSTELLQNCVAFLSTELLRNYPAFFCTYKGSTVLSSFLLCKRWYGTIQLSPLYKAVGIGQFYT